MKEALAAQGAFTEAESYAASDYASRIAEWRSLNGKIVQSGTKLYQIQFTIYPATVSTYINLASGTAPFNKATAAIQEFIDYGWMQQLTSPTGSTFRLDAYYNQYYLNIEEYSAPDQITGTISTARRNLETEPYAMFCMPYNTLKVINGATEFTAAPAYAPIIAQALVLAAGEYVKDIQLLPYCPFTEKWTGTGINIGDDVAGTDYTLFTRSDEIVQIMFWCRSNSFTLDTSFDATDLVPSDPTDFKVANQTKFCRLVSPNYVGAFEFKPTQLSGPTSTITVNVDCTYRPYNPYIHANPQFSRLYGADYNDTRGLICGGDFSITQITDAWTNYQINNKTYNEAFNRQIENMEVNQNVQRTQEKWAIGLGAITGAAGGATAGGLVGGGLAGAAIGGAVGSVASVMGGIADYELNEKLRSEALDYTTDMYRFNLANIKAQPQSITKTGAMNFNSRIWLFVEFYSAEPDEEEELRAKIQYNGMTVNRIGKISDYLQTEPTYIKGRLIRLEGLDGEDFHMAKEISNEIFKGGFM